MPYPFVQAANFTVADRSPEDIYVIVLHDMEYPVRLDGAENVANWFAGPNAPQASTHYCVDPDSIVQCVAEKDVAWHAPGANRWGLGIEQVGYARFTRGEWLDDMSRNTVRNTAALVAELCRRYDIPPRHLSDEELGAWEKGIVEHQQVTRVFQQGDHWDCGAAYPWDVFLADLNGFMNGQPTEPAPAPLPVPQTALGLPVLAEGAFGNHTAIAQALLNVPVELGRDWYQLLSIDDAFGPMTTNAVRNYQQKMGLESDGIIGERTWNALLALGGAGLDRLGPVKEGMRGNRIALAQSLLNVPAYLFNWYLPVAVNDIFDAITAETVRKYQARLGLNVDGVVGPVTWRRLLAL